MVKSLRTRVAASVSAQTHSAPHLQFTSPAGVRLGIGDDCAVLAPPRGHQILVTTDFSLESIHFRRDWHPPESVGHRCLARGLSDLAAMGAQPLAAFLSLALPPELLRSVRGYPAWRDRFFDGLLALAARYSVPLAGGDTAQPPHHPAAGNQSTAWALADIVLVGSAPRDRALLRCGGKAGDLIYVTGYLGGSAAEMARLAATPRRFRAYTAAQPGSPNPHPHLYPEPRLAIGAWLLKNRRATAAIDVSDGLSTDLDHLCQESHLAAALDAAAIPIHPLAGNDLNLALNGGEDYELLFTASPETKIPRRIAGVPITRVGEMRRKSRGTPRMILANTIEGRKKNVPLQPSGWEHYG